MEFFAAYRLLEYIKATPGSTVPEMLEKFEEFSRNRLSIYLRRMETEGLIKRERRNDARQYDPGRLPDKWYFAGVVEGEPPEEDRVRILLDELVSPESSEGESR